MCKIAFLWVKMIKLQPVKLNYRELNNSLKNSKTRQNPSFGAESFNIPKGAKDILTRACAPTKSWIRQKLNFGLNKLAETKGEIQSQIINAVFTSTLAPMFIAFNPFSKTDHKTKVYTAWRQPISAIIAIIGGVGMTMQIDKYWNMKASEGSLKSFDLRPQPNKDYLKHKYKKELKGKKGEALANAITAKQKETTDFFADLISEEPDKISFDNGNVTIKGTNIKSRKIPNINSKDELIAYLKANNLHEMNFGDFMEQHFNFEFHKGTNYHVKSFTIDKQLESVYATDFLEELGLVEKGKLPEQELNRMLGIMRENDSLNIEEFKQPFRGIKDVFGDIESIQLQEATAKQASTSIRQMIGPELANKKDIRLENLFHRFGIRDHEQIENYMRRKVSSVIKEFAQKLKGMEGLKPEANLRWFAKNMLDVKVGRASKGFDVFKAWAGIALNLPVTAITCTILNWAYPRIIERVFPDLVKSDALKGGDKK